MEPRAFAKAERLARFASECGACVREFDLILSDEEAQELLDWLPVSGWVNAEFMPQLEEDIAQARRAKDPFQVLQHFTIRGFLVTPDTTLQ